MDSYLNNFHQPVGFEIKNWKQLDFPKHELMKGVHCQLEPLNWEKHGVDLFNANQLDNDDSSWTYMFYGPFENIDAYRNWVIGCINGKDPQFYAIIDVKTKKAVGVSSFLRIDPINGCIEVGHLFFSPLLRNTIASTEAMYLMMRRVFELGYRRYEWKCHSLNKPSRIAAQRLGFSYEGIFRQAVVVKGRNRDTAWYSIIDIEWHDLQKVYLKWLAPDNFNIDGKQKLKLSELTYPILKSIG